MLGGKSFATLDFAFCPVSGISSALIVGKKFCDLGTVVTDFISQFESLAVIFVHFQIFNFFSLRFLPPPPEVINFYLLSSVN